MKNFLVTVRRNWLFVLLPMVPLVEGLFFEPFNEIKVVGDTTPFLQGLFILILLITRKIYNTPALTLVFIGIILNIIFLTEDYKLSYLIVFTLAFLLVSSSKSLENLYEKLKVFTLSYSLISIAIYFVRLVTYSFNLIRTRGGSNIYGSNELTGLLLILMIYSVIGKSYRKIDFLIFFGLYVCFGILFIRRVTLVTAALIFLVMLLTYLKPKFKKIRLRNLVIPFFFILALYEIILKFDFVESITFRFASMSNFSLSSFNDFASQTSYLRTLLWNDGMESFYDNFLFGIGAGNFKNISFHSTAHSLWINNLSEFGILIGGILNIFLIIPLFSIITKQRNFRLKFLALVCYIAFLFLSNISGVNLFQNTGYVSGFSTIGIFFMIRVVLKR